MNNYKDYYNYTNNNYNQPIYNQKGQKIDQIYDPYQGFIRGNMFPDLYNAYRVENPIEVNPKNEQAEILTYIDALCFALQDLNLYLDIYPEDKKAMELYKYYLKQNNEYLNVYQEKYGPITTCYENINTNYWDWIKSPWPWEGSK